MNKSGGTIAERLTRLVGDRKIYPWAKSIGVSKGTIESIMGKGGMPGAETLGMIQRSENARLDWLLEGRGTPYYVTVCATDQAARSVLQDLLSDEQWEVTAVSDTQRLAFVLSQPGGYDVKDRHFDYTILEVIAGAIGPQSITEVRNRFVHHMGVTGLYYAQIEANQMRQIENGEVGTYHLFGAANAILKSRKPIFEESAVFEKFMRDGEQIVAIEEVELLLNFRALGPGNQLAVKQVIAAMAPDPEEDDRPAPGM